MNMNVWGITDIGAVRRQNQDAYRIELMEPDMAFLAVCDGMGGARAGNIASRLAVELFGDAVLEGVQSGAPVPYGERMLAAVEAANTGVSQRANSDPACLGMGTTLVSALVVSGKAYIVNVGDSRAYAISQRGIWRVTRDHSVVEDLVMRGEITPEEARTHPQKNLITRALGVDARIQPDLFEVAVDPGMFLLLCSDGLSNIVTDQELLYEVLHGGPAEGCCQRLLDVALSRGAPDNVTAVLLQM